MGTVLTPAQAKRLGIVLPAKEKGQERYRGAVRTEYDGRFYMSKAEAAYAQELDQQQALGLVEWWRPQERFPLTGPDAPFKVSYVADFIVSPTARHPLWKTIVALDVKGNYLAEVFQLKAKLFLDRYPEIPLWIVKKGVPVLYVDSQKRRGRR